ncbi:MULTISPECIES: winged helix DNA-binding domain-containing protein [Nocardiopsis]|uniref:winged helix DNA-binding domain-containing protein n=1 Tax=Nocardiopsis TaxID=2013 RepID=UPI00034B9150|nr:MULTISPECIES: winged helix DNA-binding domain-containing protein [Nocardiopsis]PWV44715.1 winged helix DNA-binding protein [Nocardiopsis sp. L17-MgMaSL7]
MATTLSRRELNRATLERQFLLSRVERPATEVLSHLAGLQAQTTHTWYVGFQSRMADPDPHEVGRLLTDGTLVRMSLMRSTLHLVSAEDAAWMRPTTQEVMERDLSHGSHGKGTAGVDLEAVVTLGRKILEERPLSPKELGEHIGAHWEGVDGEHLAYVVRCLLPVVQIPPRGVWGASGQPVLAPADTWTGWPMAPGPDRERLVLRYLAAFGPASVMDVQAWSGLTRLKAVVEGLRERLVSFRDPSGTELFDLPDAPRPSADVPAPVRFLYDFDNLLRGHADRSRVVSHENLRGLSARNGMPPATVLVDGEVSASWRVDRGRGTPSLDITPFRAFNKSEIEEITAEGDRLLAFLHPGQESAGPRFTDRT